MTGRIWAWVRVLGGAGIIALLVWRLGTAAFLDGLRVIDAGTALAAIGIGLLTTVFSAWRWCLVARGIGLRLPLRSAVGDYYRSQFLNSALPGGVLGDVHRAVRHGRDVGDVGRGVRAVVLERTAGQIVLVVVAVAVLLVQPPPVLPPVHLLSTGQATAVAVGGAVLAVAIFAWSRLRPGISRAARALRTAAAEVRLGVLARGSWPGIVLASTVALAGHLTMFLVAARAAGSTAPIAVLMPLMVLALLVMAVPVNIGGWGPREGFCAWAFGAAGLGATQGLTIAVVYGLLAFVGTLPGVGVLMVRWFNRQRAARLTTEPELRLSTQT